MRFLALSDTHRKHHQLYNLPPADVIIHAGDFTSRGTEREVVDFLEWFSSLNYSYKVFIAGNHDFLMETASPASLATLIPEGLIYLNDGSVTIEGIKIWGSPITPWFHDWAFNRNRGPDIAKHWQRIPEDADIIVTHGPVHGILDYTSSGIHAGCEELLKRVQQIKPSYYISGHIHEAYGMEKLDETTFINASLLDEYYAVANKPVIFDFNK